MKSLIWKELRENIRWALLAMIVFGGAMAYALYQAPNDYQSYYYNDGITLLKKSFLLVTTFGAPIIGLFLGLMQILPELKRDQWAALLHRPVSRGTVYAGKSLSGVILYGIAAVLPFALAVWYVVTPGNFGAPFVPGMESAGLADVATGLAYYFAALLLALQRGGWGGLRALPVLAAIHMSYFVQSVSLFYVAMEAALLLALVLGLAAWGAIRNQDRFAPRPWLGYVAFLVVVYYGVCGLGDIGRSLLVALGPAPRSESQRYELTRDGQPILLKYVNNVVQTVSTPDGTPLNDPKFKPDRVRTELKYLNGFSSYIGDAHGWKPPERSFSYRQTYSYLYSNSPNNFPRLEQWFQILQPRLLVCYLPDKRRAVDRLDLGGFVPLSAPVQPFPNDYEVDSFQDAYVLSGTGSARFASLPSRKIHDIPLPAPGPIFGTGSAYATKGGGSVSVFGFTFSTGVALYNHKAELVAFLPYHQDVDRWGSLSVGIDPDLNRFFLWYRPSAWIPTATQKTMPSYVDVVDKTGTVLSSSTLPPLPAYSRGKPLHALIERGLQSPAVYFGNMLYRKIGASFGNTRLKNALDWQLGSGWEGTKATAIWSVGISLALAIVTLLWSRRVHLSQRRSILWVVIVLLFNVPGCIAFRFATDWPRLVACRACRRSRAVDAQNCPSCGEGWPHPARAGTEIFDRQDTTLTA